MDIWDGLWTNLRRYINGVADYRGKEGCVFRLGDGISLVVAVWAVAERILSWWIFLPIIPMTAKTNLMKRVT